MPRMLSNTYLESHDKVERVSVNREKKSQGSLMIVCEDSVIWSKEKSGYRSILNPTVFGKKIGKIVVSLKKYDHSWGFSAKWDSDNGGVIREVSFQRDLMEEEAMFKAETEVIHMFESAMLSLMQQKRRVRSMEKSVDI